ncbi:hypothetical protein O3P69_019276 [Scylla paramamosain]|uniref:Serpin domain-containing protein n=1 Tax=Scylla paramamosain TaxID=85552 RepID=A0AAW0SX54_SCYPA
MKSLLLLLPPLLLPATTAKTTTTTTTPAPQNCPANERNAAITEETIKNGVTELGMQLLRELGTERNTLISPFSLWSAVAMVLVGAEGQTANQIADVLQVGGKQGVLPVWRGLSDRLQREGGQHSDVSLKVGNRIYVNNGYQIKNCMEALADILVHTSLDQPIDASRVINSYINTTTNGKIPEIITPGHLTDTKMVVVNAVYFKGSWEHQFVKNETALKPFYPTPGSPGVDVPMMRVLDVNLMLGTSDILQAQIIQLPYKDNLFKMTILLPTERGEAGFNATLNALNANTFWAALDTLTLDIIDLEMPKFEIKAKFADDLKAAMQTLGMTDAFTNAADLSSFGPELYIKHLLHRTFLSVDEEGSEAAAATGAVISTKISGFVNIDRPFLFAIHNTDILFFLGAFMNP